MKDEATPAKVRPNDGLGAGAEARCACAEKAASDCPGEWEPGCDLGNSEAHAKAAPAPAGLDAALGLVLLPPIRVSERSHAVLTRIAAARGMTLQAVAREALEPGETTGA